MRGTVQAEAEDPVDAAANILVVCIGNELVADDALGYEVYNRLALLPLPEGVVLHYASVGGLSLLDWLIDGYSAIIIVDAVRFGAPPGTLHRLRWDELPDFSSGAISAHNVGLRDTVAVASVLYPERLPQDILLVGVEGRCFDRPREAMTPEVAEAISPTVSYIQQLIHSVQRGAHEEIHSTGGNEQISTSR